MAGKLVVDTIDTDNAFITLNVQQSLIATMNVSGIYSNTGVKMIGANGAVSNTAITGLVTAAQIATVANTQITGNITSSQITSNPTFYGNVSVTGTLAATGASTFTGTGKFATTIGVGNATPSASGSGITFPATQSASSDANTLDDYEEGTWTPTLGAGSLTITNATYTKIGVQVTLFFTVALPVQVSGLDADLYGLPFVIRANGGNAAALATDRSSTDPTYSFGFQSQSRLRFSDGLLVVLTLTQMSGKTARGCFTYQI